MYSSEDPTHEFSPDYAQDGLRILISNPLMSTHTHTLNFSYSVCAIGEMLLVGWVVGSDFGFVGFVAMKL